ncbi:hypothetical protein ANCCAN_02479 [Ancylostoma caninum]|uniref:Uncharacterized protein n=1 Tax=Ancylostoma caninum TaxID=29170 RepID=A0A368H409_ANCCA|nr:hypothetical protein ANCCAN_02479 [Ancylostoma caninum]
MEEDCSVTTDKMTAHSTRSSTTKAPAAVPRRRIPVADYSHENERQVRYAARTVLSIIPFSFRDYFHISILY